MYVILEWQCHRYALCAFFASFIQIYMVMLNMMNECGQRAQLHLIHHQLNGRNTAMFAWGSCKRQEHTNQTVSSDEYESSWMWKRIGVRSNFGFFFTYQKWISINILTFDCSILFCRSIANELLNHFIFIQFMIYNERSDLREEKKYVQKTFCVCMMQKKDETSKKKQVTITQWGTRRAAWYLKCIS